LDEGTIQKGTSGRAGLPRNNGHPS
jgi:hypothetical protein